MLVKKTNTLHVELRYRNACGTVLTVNSYNLPYMTGPTNLKTPLKNSTTLNTFPISLTGTTLIIIERKTVVVVESRNPIPAAKYTIQVVVIKHMMKFFIMQVNASNLKLKNEKIKVL